MDTPNLHQLVNRREFFGLMGTAAGLSALAGYELIKEGSGLKTPSGIYLLVPEHHDSYPLHYPECDYYYREYVREGGELLTRGETDIFSAISRLGPEMYPTPVLERYAKKGTKILFIDNDAPPQWGKFEVDLLVKELQASYIGVGAFAAKKSLEILLPQKKISRRKVDAAILGMTAWAGLRWVDLHLPHEISNSQNRAIRRVGSRILGTIHHLHPEEISMFMRNVFVASKLLHIGQEHLSNTGKLATFTMQVGAAHGGLEDLLMAGSTFCHALLISLYPAPLLQQFVDYNGGLDDAVCSRIVSLPPDINKAKLDDANTFQDIKKYNDWTWDRGLQVALQLKGVR